MTTALATTPSASLALADIDSQAISTVRGKTHLSLAELNARVANYKEPARAHTLNAQAFFVRHCNSDIGLFRALANDKLNFRASDSYFNNWLKGFMFTDKGGGAITADSQSAKKWIAFCESLAEYDRTTTEALKLSILESPTFRAIYSFVIEKTEPTAACRFGGLVGPTGSQKTSSLKLTKLKLGHRCVRFECPARRSLAAFQRKLAEQYNAKVGNSREKIEESIRGNVDDKSVIIIENMQRAYYAGAGDDQPIYNYLLELQEDTSCTIILCFTPEFYATSQGLNALGFFEQFFGRMGGLGDILVLPDYTPKADLKFFARCYDLHDGKGALEMLTKWSTDHGRVRIVFAKLQRAQKIARLQERTNLTLADLEAANAYSPPTYMATKEEEDAS